MFHFKTKKKIYVVRKPGSALFDEARFVLKEGAALGGKQGQPERELAREAERIIAEYGLLPFSQKSLEERLVFERKRDRLAALWFFAGIFTSAGLFLLAAGVLKMFF